MGFSRQEYWRGLPFSSPFFFNLREFKNIYTYILETGQKWCVCKTVTASLYRNFEKIVVLQVCAVLTHQSLISLLVLRQLTLLTGIFARYGQICSVKHLVCTVSLKARCIRKRMFGPTGRPAHLINIYKKSFFLLSTKTETLTGAGTGQGILWWTKTDTL